jgi:hypothetical protein
VERVDEEQRCPRCGTPYAHLQEYCLECGLRLPTPVGLVALLGSAWRRHLGGYPGDWIWPTLLALVVAAIAGVVSVLWLADRSSSATPTVVATSPAATSIQEATVAPEPTTAPATLPTSPGTGSTLTAPGTAPPGPRSGQPIAWPAGRSGWTIVLDSVPSTNGRAGVIAEARQASRLGMKKVGVLDSGQFSSLHPGYYVVFAGIYATQAEAQSHVIDAHRRGYRAPYPRQITP